MAQLASEKVKQREIAIVGGGILGLALAAVCAARGYHVCLIRMSDHGRPRADTLRNQGWLQSGLMYVGHYGAVHDPTRKLGRALAARMRIGGLAMLRDLGIPLPDENECGVFRLKNEEQLEKLLEDASHLRLRNVERLENHRAQSMLGSVFAEDSIYCTVPDQPFPEASVVRALREWGVREGVEFVQVERPIRLVANGNSESGVLLEWEGNQLASKVTVCAAGAGNCELLNGLDIAPMMEFQQTPLLVAHDAMSIKAPIFNDRVRGFSFVRHPEDPDTLPNGALVIATRSQRIVPFSTPEARRIDEQDIEVFASHLPEAFEPFMETGRFTAGYEVIPKTTPERPYVAPWIHWCPEFRALVHAMPGRATLGLSVAREMLTEIETRIGVPKLSGVNLNAAVAWDDDIHMHFHQDYDFNDWERPEGGN
jgi:glycine/D-amino acid oxidase-like deaminating enzyme